MTWLELIKTYFWNERYAPASCKKTKDFKYVQKRIFKEAIRLLRKNLK